METKEREVAARVVAIHSDAAGGVISTATAMDLLVGLLLESYPVERPPGSVERAAHSLAELLAARVLNFMAPGAIRLTYSAVEGSAVVGEPPLVEFAFQRPPGPGEDPPCLLVLSVLDNTVLNPALVAYGVERTAVDDAVRSVPSVEIGLLMREDTRCPDSADDYRALATRLLL